MPILAMYSNTCTYERRLCFDVCFHLLSCFTRLPTSTALQATPNPTTPDVMGPPWPEHTRQSRNAPCPQSFGTLPSRRKKNPQTAGITFESWSMSSMPVRPTWLPNNHVPVFAMQVPIVCFWSHEFVGRFFLRFYFRITTYIHLLLEGGSPSTNGKKLFAAWLPANDHLRSWRKGSRTCAIKGCRPKSKGRPSVLVSKSMLDFWGVHPLEIDQNESTQRAPGRRRGSLR